MRYKCSIIASITLDKESQVRKKVNYLNNKDMLAEIHKSKVSFCDYDKAHPEHAQQDIILDSVDDILHAQTIILAKEQRAARIADVAYRTACKERPEDKPKLSQFKFDPNTITVDELVFRVMTYDHIPQDLERKKTKKTVADHHVRLNFHAFKHYIIEHDDNNNMVVREVLKSHTRNGQFCLTHGSITDNLAKMFMALVNKYSQKGNWRGYTYIDEMRGQALLQLSSMGLQFNEAKSANPFAYYTSSVSNSFTGVLNSEKKNQNIRDDLLVRAGQSPSFTRQLAIEEEIRLMRDKAETDSTD